MDPIELGRMVRYHRRRAGLSRKDLSTLSNVSQSVIYEIERGKKTVTMKSVLSVLHALNLTLDLNGPFAEEFYRSQSEYERSS